MVDAAVVMIENAHKGLEEFREHNNRDPKGQERWQLMGASASEVGPALFVSLLVITLSFVPVFSLEGQSGRLFSPLAFTKTYSMAAAAFLSRSEEHTSELQSLMRSSYAVFCLKKKNT